MSVNARVWKPGEKSKQVRRFLFWPLLIVLLGVLCVLTIMVAPRWLGYDRTLANRMPVVIVYNAPDTRSQAIVKAGGKTIAAKITDLTTRNPDGSANVPIEVVADPKKGTMFIDKKALIQNVQILRVLPPNVIAVGSAPENELFVLIPPQAEPSPNKDWGPQLDAKARVNVTGVFRQMPSGTRLKELLHIDPTAEASSLPPVYMIANSVHVVETKPMFGDSD